MVHYDACHLLAVSTSVVAPSHLLCFRPILHLFLLLLLVVMVVVWVTVLLLMLKLLLLLLLLLLSLSLSLSLSAHKPPSLETHFKQLLRTR